MILYSSYRDNNFDAQYLPNDWWKDAYFPTNVLMKDNFWKKKSHFPTKTLPNDLLYHFWPDFCVRLAFPIILTPISYTTFDHFPNVPVIVSKLITVFHWHIPSNEHYDNFNCITSLVHFCKIMFSWAPAMHSQLWRRTLYLLSSNLATWFTFIL